MPRSLCRLLGAFVVVMAAACSENFGPAPPDGGRVVMVRSEGFAGPRTDRLGTALAVAGTDVFVATDAGLFGFVAGRTRDWSPVHGGFLTIDSEPRVGVVTELVVSTAGDLVFYRGEIGPSDALVASRDGGDFFERIPRPDALLTSVAAIGIAPAGALGADGAWLAIQGGQVFSRGTAGGDWLAHLLPRAPLEVAAVVANGDGRIGIAVAPTDPSDWTLWASPGPGEEVEESGAVLDGPALALAWHDGSLHVATPSGVWHDGVQSVTWDEAIVERAALVSDGAGLRWALVGRRPDSSLELATGIGDGAVQSPTDLPPGTVVAVATGAEQTRVLYADASTSSGAALDPYAGVEVGLSALASRPEAGILAAGQTRTGEIFQGPIADPAGFGTRGTPLRSSVPRSVIFDPSVPDALFVGSFGVYRSDPLTALWQDRNNGFASYDPGYFAGPFPVSGFDVLPGGEFWVGGVSGDGPYRSLDAGLSWQRVHDGLGEPGSYMGEAGLPLVSQAKAFVRDQAGQIWMGGFRGGAFRLDEGTDVWEQESRGLPRTDGVPLEHCCPVPGESEVDVRDLVALGDGSILAATGWGVYRLQAGASAWEERSTGLFNRDVTRLLRHPQDSSTVVAAARGRPESADWLFLTEDAGRTWFPVASELIGRSPVDLVWSDPARLEVVVLLEAQGAWRMELDP